MKEIPYKIEKKLTEKLKFDEYKLDFSDISDIHEAVIIIPETIIFNNVLMNSEIDDYVSWGLQYMFLMANL